MAAVVLTMKRNKRTHRTFTATGSGVAADTAALSELTPAGAKSGPIATFLAGTYADEAAANVAAANAGISLYAYGAGGNTLLRWTVAANAISGIGWTSAAASPLVIGIRGPAAIGG
jgi:hypothetical protein